jgi:hypothetical protein
MTKKRSLEMSVDSLEGSPPPPKAHCGSKVVPKCLELSVNSWFRGATKIVMLQCEDDTDRVIGISRAWLSTYSSFYRALVQDTDRRKPSVLKLPCKLRQVLQVLQWFGPDRQEAKVLDDETYKIWRPHTIVGYLGLELQQKLDIVC